MVKQNAEYGLVDSGYHDLTVSSPEAGVRASLLMLGCNQDGYFQDDRRYSPLGGGVGYHVYTFISLGLMIASVRPF